MTYSKCYRKNKTVNKVKLTFKNEGGQILKKLERKGRGCRKGPNEEEFHGEWTAPAPEVTAPQPKAAEGAEGAQEPPVPILPLPAEDRLGLRPLLESGLQLPLLRPLNTVWLTGSWCSSRLSGMCL